MPDVVTDGVIASAWGNQIRDRTAIPFTNTAARDAAIASGARKVGMLTYQQTEDTFTYWTGSAWKPLGARGELAIITGTANSTGFGGGAGGTIPPYIGLTAFLATGRLYYVEFSGTIGQPVAGQGSVRIQSAGVNIGGVQYACSNWCTYPTYICARVVGAGASRSFDVAADTNAAGTAINASATQPAHFRIVDMGAS
jgi:hypothetical protein